MNHTYLFIIFIYIILLGIYTYVNRVLPNMKNSGDVCTQVLDLVLIFLIFYKINSATAGLIEIIVTLMILCKIPFLE